MPVLVDALAQEVIADLLSAGDSTSFELLAFVVMPDHVHVLAQGMRDDASAIAFMQRFKQPSGFTYKRRYGSALWQQSFYDRIVRKNEDVAAIGRYILENPVRAGIVSAEELWPYSGDVGA